MTIVYVDMLFFLNLIANYLLLLGAGRVAGAILQRWRIALGAAAGALYAILVFVPGMGWLDLWPCKILSGVLMSLISYGGERSLLRITALFFGASAGLAGLILATELLGESGLTIENGVLYSSFDLRLLLLLIAACYFIMSLFFRRTGRHGIREKVQLEIRIKRESIILTALVDSGHTLTDPANNQPVVVADGQCFRSFLPNGIDLFDPVEGMKQCREAGVLGVRLVPYRAVGVDCGILLAIRADSVSAGGRRLGSLLIALSPTPVDTGGGYQALIGGI